MRLGLAEVHIVAICGFDLALLAAVFVGFFSRLFNPRMGAEAAAQTIVLSVAARGREGLPSRETLEAVEGYPLLRTDRNGWIEITTDGEQMWMEAERR